MRAFTGYHGATAGCGIKIVSEQRFLPSTKPEEWLGIGVYFFEDSVGHAFNWCIKAREYVEYCVLKAIIICENDRVLDLTKPEAFELFQMAKREFKKAVLKKSRFFKNKRIPDGVILDRLCYERPIDLVRQAFVTPPWGHGQIVPTQIQLCVKNPKCIGSIAMEVFNNGDGGNVAGTTQLS